MKVMPTEVFSSNITHNLNKMATEAGIYKHLLRQAARPKKTDFEQR
jgi:hypothetical protein